MVSTRVKKMTKGLINRRSKANVEITLILIQGQRVHIYMKRGSAIGTQSLMSNLIDAHSQNLIMPKILR